MILHDPAEPAVVKRCAALFAADVEAVTGRRPQIVTSLPESGQLVIVGTVEKSALIQRIARAGKIDIRALDGAWERYLIQLERMVRWGKFRRG